MTDWETLAHVAVPGILAYLVGSINLSIVASRLVKREGALQGGSGNPGVTNLLRAAGRRVAVTVLAAELVKACAVMWGVALFGGREIAPAYLLPFLLGNLFPLFHRFKGGKGVAAAVGAFLALSPPVMLLGGGVFIAVYAVWRRVSAGSLAMVCAYPLLSWWLDGRPALVAVSVTVSLVLFFTHRANLARLFRGEEPRTDIGRRANHAP